MRLYRRCSEDGGEGGAGCSTCSNPASLSAEAVACKRVGHGSRQIRPAECRRRQEEGAERRAAGETQVFVWRAALIHISSFFFPRPHQRHLIHVFFLLEHPRRKLCFPRGPPRSVLHSLLGLASARSALTEKQRAIQSVSPVKGDLRRYVAFNPRRAFGGIGAIGEPEPPLVSSASLPSVHSSGSSLVVLTGKGGMVEKERTGSVITERLRYCRAPPPSRNGCLAHLPFIFRQW